MTNDDLYRLLRPAVMTVSGVPMVIMAAQNAPAPTGSYASIHVRTDIGERGMAAQSKRLLDDNETFEHTNTSHQEVTCVVEFYRARAKEYAANLLQMDKREDVIWSLFKAGINIMRTGPMLDLTALQSDQYEERAHVDLYLRMDVSQRYDINRILEASATVQNEDGDDLQTVTTTVNP